MQGGCVVVASQIAEMAFEELHLQCNTVPTVFAQPSLQQDMISQRCTVMCRHDVNAPLK